MKKSSCILWIFALAGALSAQAQNIVEVKPDKKNGGETIKRIYDPHRQCVAVGFAYKW